MTRAAQRSLPEILFEIGKVVGSNDEPAALLSFISGLTCELVGADAVSIMLLDHAGERLLTKAAHGLHTGDSTKVSFARGEGVAGWVVVHAEPALLEDVRSDPRFVRRERASTPIESLVCVPLLARGEPIGAMTATSTRLAAFDRDALDVLSFVAKTIALDIENVRLRRVAVTDALTGCFNRELLQQRLAVELALAGQRESPLSVALVDVDHFKAINDRHGHDVGDKVLVVIADRLRSAIRADDVLVRYGGDEFLALLPNTAVAVAREIGARMRERMEESGVQTDGRSITTRVSVGVAEYHGVSPDALLRRVDAALYAAKRGGRNRVEVAE